MGKTTIKQVNGQQSEALRVAGGDACTAGFTKNKSTGLCIIKQLFTKRIKYRTLLTTVGICYYIKYYVT